MNELLEAHFRRVLETDSLFASARQEAWEKLLSGDIAEALLIQDETHSSIPQSSIKGLGAACLVLENGVWNEEKSCLDTIPEEVVITTFRKAVRSYGFLVTQSFSGTDPASLLNHALFEDGLFLYIPPGCLCPPIQILNVASQPTATKNVIFCGSGSRVELINNFSLASWYNESFTIDVADGARCTFLQARPERAVSLRRVVVGRDGSYDEIIAGGSRTEQVDIALSGEGAKATSFGLWNNSAHSHFTSTITHNAPATVSLQRYKSVLAEGARLELTAVARCLPGSRGAEARQKIDTLLESEHARYEVKPILEILHDDVVASHGATSGKIDEEALLYFMTRGLCRQEAKAQIVRAFCKEIILKTPYGIFYE